MMGMMKLMNTYYNDDKGDVNAADDDGDADDGFDNDDATCVEGLFGHAFLIDDLLNAFGQIQTRCQSGP